MGAEGVRRRRRLDAQHAQRGPVHREMHIAVARPMAPAETRNRGPNFGVLPPLGNKRSHAASAGVSVLAVALLLPPRPLEYAALRCHSIPSDVPLRIALVR